MEDGMCENMLTILFLFDWAHGVAWKMQQRVMSRVAAQEAVSVSKVEGMEDRQVASPWSVHSVRKSMLRVRRRVAKYGKLCGESTRLNERMN